MRSKWLKWLWIPVFVLAIAYFLYRGPWREIHDSGDFMPEYLSSRVWLHGLDPYQTESFSASAQAGGLHTLRNFHNLSVYPPPVQLILSPLAIFSWTTAKILWLICLVGISLWIIIKYAQVSKPYGAAVGCFLLSFAHFHSGLNEGNPVVLVCALLLLSLWTPGPYAAGFLLGLAVCIKPQLAGGFVILALCQRQFKKVAAAGAMAIVTTVAACLVMPAGSLQRWVMNLQETTSPTGINNGSITNQGRWSLTNIDVLIPQMLYHKPLIWAIYGIIALATLIAVWKTKDQKIALALIATATLLIGYHRSYDAQLLWVCVPLMISLLTNKELSRWRKGFLWVPCVQFLFPLPALAHEWLGVRESTPGALLLLHHETLTIVGLWALFAWLATRPGKVSVATPRLQRDALTA